MLFGVTALLLVVLTIFIGEPAFLAAGLQTKSWKPASPTIFPENGALLGLVTDLNTIDALECQSGKKNSVIKIYQAFWHSDFWEDFAIRIRERGAIEFLSLDPVIKVGNQEVGLNPCQVLTSAENTTTLITAFAQQIKDWGYPILVSTAGEMNGDWAAWSGAKNFGPNCDQTYTQTIDLYGQYDAGCADPVIGCADGPERYRDMYRHIHDIFVEVGATNVTWVWVVNHASFPSEIDASWNHVTNYYPGDSYVDVISVDGYNWGECRGDWNSFPEVFSDTLAIIRSNYPHKPVIVGEFASAEGLTSIGKATWIRDAFNGPDGIQSWPEIKAVIWFNSPVDCVSFPIPSTAESLMAYQESIADDYWVGESLWCSHLPFICKMFP
jgi:hypothetical protein